MKEKDFLDEEISFENELIKIARPARGQDSSEDASEWQSLGLVLIMPRYPKFCFGE
jgi:hypothetical protein